jgi:hypothetical protein
VTIYQSNKQINFTFKRQERNRHLHSISKMLNSKFDKKYLIMDQSVIHQVFLQNNFPTRISWKEQTISCKYGALGCPKVFPHSRPQPRLQHEAACKWMGVTCQWGQDCKEETPLQDLASHLTSRHGHLLRSINQEDGRSIKLSQVKFILNRHDDRRVFRFCRVMGRQAGRIAQDAAVLLSS